MIIFEAESTHDIETLYIEAGLGLFNILKIVGVKHMMMYIVKLEDKGISMNQ